MRHQIRNNALQPGGATTREAEKAAAGLTFHSSAHFAASVTAEGTIASNYDSEEAGKLQVLQTLGELHYDKKQNCSRSIQTSGLYMRIFERNVYERCAKAATCMLAIS